MYVCVYIIIYHNCRCKVQRNVLNLFLKSVKLLIDLISSDKPSRVHHFYDLNHLESVIFFLGTNSCGFMS